MRGKHECIEGGTDGTDDNQEAIYDHASGHTVAIPELVRRAWEQDHEAFTLLYNHYKHPLSFHLLWRTRDSEESHDLYQETFLRVWECITGERTITEVPVNGFRLWLYRVATNRAYDYLRHTKLIGFTELPDEQVDEEDFDLFCLKEAVANLSPKQQECLVLHYYQGFSHREIAAQLDISEAAVSKQISRAVQSLRQYYTTC